MVLLSGGIDSATCLYVAKKKYAVRALTFSYHGIARGEMSAAKSLSERAGVVEHRIVRLRDLREAADIDGSSFPGLPPTYIPMRNAVFYSYAASIAEEGRAAAVVGGHNADDLVVFPDTRRRFFDALQKAVRVGSASLRRRRFRYLRPLESRRKYEVVRLAASTGVPLELTWSCHRNGKRHCWGCEGCRGRIDAFERAGIPDPLFNEPSRAKIS